MENKKRAEKKYNYTVRKKLKRILAVTLSLLMVTSVIDYSAFTVSAQTALGASEDNAESQETGIQEVSAQQSSINEAEALTVEPDNADASVTEANGELHYYGTLVEAIAAAQGMGDSTVTLMKDAVTENMVTINSGTFTINLNNKTWTYNKTVPYVMLQQRSPGEITIINGNTTGGAIMQLGGTLIIDNVTLSTNGFEALNVGGGKLIFNSGAVKVTNNEFGVCAFGCNVQVNGGTFEGAYRADIRATEGASLEVNGGEIKGTLEVNSSANATLKGGSYGIVNDISDNAGRLLANGYAYRYTSEGTPWVQNAAVKELSGVTVKQAPVQITAQPQDASVTYGYASPHTLNVAVVKNDVAAGDISYQWYRDGTSISDATEASFDIPTAFEAGTYSFYCAVSCDGYIVNTQNAVFTVAKATPTVKFKANTTGGAPYSYGNETSFEATVLGVSNQKPDGTVTFKDGENVIATADFNSNWLNYYSGDMYLDAGNHSFTAVYNPSSTGSGKNYESAVSATLEQAIAKANQIPISITPVTGKIYTNTKDSFKLTTTGGNGTGEVTYSVLDNKDVLSISEDTATIVGAGTVKVTAVKASDVNYKSATAIYDITVAKAPAPTITFPTASGITYGQKMSDSHLKGGSTEYGTFTWEGDDLVPVVNGGTNYNNVIFTPSADTIKNYETISNIYKKLTLGFAVTQATPTISLEKSVYGNPGNRTANLTVKVNPVGSGNYPTGTLRFIDCTSGSDVDITGATTVAMVGSQTDYVWTGLADKVYKIKVVYSGDDQYNAVTSKIFEVDTVKKNQSPLIIGNIGAKTYGDGVITLTTTGGDGEGWVSFTSSDSTIVSFPKPELMARLKVANKNTSNHEGAVATIHRAGTVTITATKYGDNTYNTTSTSITLKVGKKALVVKADDKQNIVAGSAMPQLTYSVTGLVGSDTFTGPTIVTTAADSNTIGEHEIRISGGTLTNAENYEVTYTNAKLTIMKTSIDHAVVSGITDQNYNGSALEQSGLFVQVNGKTLTKDIDYTVDYKNNTEIGTATVAITGKGIYTGTIAKNFQINVSNGATYTISNMVYMVTSSETNGNGTVTLIKSTKSKSKLKGTLKIRDTVKIGGQSFKITSIDAKAFKGYTKLTKVTIGKNVITIGKEAFSGCSKVSSVTIGTGLKAISNNAFYNCKKLKTVTINSKQLKTVGKNALKNTYGSAAIKVPSSKVSAYKKLFKSKTGFTEDKKIKKI